MNERFNLMFSGDLARGVELEVAKKNLAALFKISSEQVDKLFSGKPIPLKKHLDFDTANKYRVAIKKAGCIVELVECEQQAAEPKKQKAVFVTDDPARSSPKPAESLSDIPPEVRRDSVAASTSTDSAGEHSGLSLAPTGSAVLLETEKEHVEPQHVETAHLSVAPGGGDLLKPEEKTQAVIRDIAVTAELAPVGADLLSDSEKEAKPATQVDVSAYTLAEAGANLEQLEEVKERLNPDISHLSLE